MDTSLLWRAFLKKLSAPLAILLPASLLLLSLNSNAEWQYQEHQIFGTQVTIQLWAESKPEGETAMKEVVDELWRIHNQLSPYIAESELSKLNNSAFKKPQAISAEMASLINKSLYFGQISNGAFDISFASIGLLYDYREHEKPSEEEIASLTAAINYRLIQLDEEKLEVEFTHPHLKIDLGGIAKGYAVDRAIEILKYQGIKHAAVTAGGDSKMLGDKLGTSWVVGIKNPRDRGSIIKIPLDDFAISTSGDYERFFIDEESGERVHHIMNPSTGKSADDVMSVSVIGPSGFDTDPLSTAVFVLGVEKGLSLIEQFEDFDAVIIDNKGTVHFSSGLMSPE